MSTTKIRLAVGSLLMATAAMPAFADPYVPVAEPQIQESTIGRIARKQRELDELKLDMEIAKLRNEIMPPPPVFMPQTMQVPSQSGGHEAEADSSLVVSAIFGEEGNLRAEIFANGVPYIVSKGSQNVPGWRVDDVQNNRVVMSKGKRSKTVFLTSAPGQQNSARPVPPSLPGLPSNGL